jgi:DNA-binding transcriptional regulator YhcF (GntR family)
MTPHLRLDKQSPLSIGDQLTGQLRVLIQGGELKPGERLPTAKALAEALDVNPNTVATAYRALEIEGFLVQRKRAGTRVAEKPPRKHGKILALQLGAELAARAAALGLDVSEVTRAVAATCALRAEAPRYRIAVLGETPLQASATAEKARALLGDRFAYVPLTPTQYESADYHLTLIDPELSAPLKPATQVHSPIPLPPHYLDYDHDFPAGAD